LFETNCFYFRLLDLASNSVPLRCFIGLVTLFVMFTLQCPLRDRHSLDHNEAV